MVVNQMANHRTSCIFKIMIVPFIFVFLLMITLTRVGHSNHPVDYTHNFTLDNHFQVDLNQIYSICIGQSSNNRSFLCKEDNKKEMKTNSIECSSFLILKFPSCWFRIFPFKPLTDDREMRSKNDNHTTTFDAVRSRLKRILSSDCLLPFPLSYSGLTAPSEKLSESDTTRQHTGYDTYSDPLGCSRRCLNAYSQAWKDLILFDGVLGNSNLESSIISKQENKFKYVANNLMTKIPQQVSQSFMEGRKWTKALELQENKIASKIRDFDDIIDEFWNDLSEQNKKKKRRRNIIEGVESWNSRNLPDDVARFADILKEHKKCVIAKHELYLLPQRG